MISILLLPLLYPLILVGALVYAYLNIAAGAWFDRVRGLRWRYKILACVPLVFLAPLAIYYRVKYRTKFLTWPDKPL